MAREKARRYTSAEALAEDLQAWLDHRVVRAYRTGPTAEFISWIRRNRLAAGVGAAAVAAFLAAGAWWMVQERNASLRLRERLAQQYLRQGQALNENGRLDEGLHLLARAWEECPVSAAALAQDIHANLQGWTRRCNRLLQVLDMKGKRHAPAPCPRRCHSPSVPMEPGWSRGLGRSPGRIWSIATGTPVGRPMDHASAVDTVYFARDGRRIVTSTAEGSVQLWSNEGEPIGSPWTADAARVVPSQAQSWVAVAGRDGGVDVWSTETGARIGERIPGTNTVTALAFTSDGRRLLAGYEDESARAWSLPSGQPVGEPIRSLGGRSWPSASMVRKWWSSIGNPRPGSGRWRRADRSARLSDTNPRSMRLGSVPTGRWWRPGARILLPGSGPP